MKKSQIKVGGFYKAKVSDKVVTVRVDKIDENCWTGGNTYSTVYRVTNLSTGRKTTFRSAAKFREETPAPLVSAENVGGQHGGNGASPKEEAEAAPKLQTVKVNYLRTGDKVVLDDDLTSYHPELKKGTVGVVVSERPCFNAKWLPGGVGVRFDKAGNWDILVKGLSKIVDCPTDTTGAMEDEKRPDPIMAGPSATSAVLPSPGAMSVIAAPRKTLADSLRKTPAVVDNSPHLIVEARAGTGKTTTLVEGLKIVLGLPSALTPSPQQKAVWDAMAMSKGKVKTICFVAFNKSIAEELKKRVPAGCQASTMHGMGFKAVRNAFGNVQVNEYRVSDIIAELLGRDIRELRRDPRKADIIQATTQLVGLCKMNLVSEADADELDALAGHYEVELNGNRAEVYDLVPRVLERCQNVAADNCIDYNDMIWLPVALSLPVFKFDMLLVDEAQDLNRCQQALAKMAGKRLILCGDPKQAIYGFAGADAESMSRMEEELRGSIRLDTPEDVANLGHKLRENRGVILLPLTVTRRCGKRIVAEAQKIVPDFDAFETNPEGKVYRSKMTGIDRPAFPLVVDGVPLSDTHDPNSWNYRSQASDGDMVLCRVNAPLVSECFRFIKAGRKANIQGRDVGKGLISTITKTKAENVVDLSSRLSDWLHDEARKETAKRNPSENRLIALQDRYDCLMCFLEGAKTVQEVIAKIESIFTDNKTVPGIRLSSVHKAKGLEARRVFILEPEGATMPHPMAKSPWQKEQEWNLRYVAITRAIEELVYVS